MAGGEDRLVTKHPPDDMQPGGQACLGEAAGYAGRWLLRQVERVGKRRPAEHRRRVHRAVPGGQGVEGRHRDRRREKQIVALQIGRASCRERVLQVV